MLPIFDILSPIINKVLDFIPDPKLKAEAALKAQEELQAHQEKIIEMLSASDQKQTDVNVEEAKSSSLFIAGARPFILWTCGFSFAWVFVLEPVTTFVFSACGHPLQDLPKIDFSTMSTVLMGILGLGGLRTYEKFNNVQGNH